MTAIRFGYSAVAWACFAVAIVTPSLSVTFELVWTMQAKGNTYEVTTNEFLDGEEEFPIEWLPIYRKVVAQENILIV